MFKFVSGIVVGVLVTLMALNPLQAKQVAFKTVDVVHSGYKVGSKVVDDVNVDVPLPSAIQLIPEIKAPVKNKDILVK